MSTVMPASSAPVAHELSDFDPRTGSYLERLLFNNRLVVLLLCIAVTLFLGFQSRHVQMNASFEKMLPTGHPYIVNYLANQSELAGAGNVVRVVLTAKDGSILEPKYLDALRQLSDELYLLPGVDRPRMKSLWTPSSRWLAVTEDGLDGGPVMPDDYDGSPRSLEQLHANLVRSNEIGQTVAGDLTSSVIVVPLLNGDASQSQGIDYSQLAHQLEELRVKYARDGMEVHITGFAKVIGDLLDGLQQILAFFAVSILIAAALLFWFTRCVRSTMLVLMCSIVAVVWQLGLLPMLGFDLDPYSILVPFLVFAIGISHGAQKMNGIMQDIGRGAHRILAARYTFRRLFLAGMTALLCDVVGFAVLMLINIPVIQQLALIASLGVGVLIFTNLIMLPVLLSFTGVSPAAALRSLREETGEADRGIWQLLSRFTTRRWAMATVAVTLFLGIGGYVVSHHLRIGDLDAGAPELRADSRYNRDVAYLTAHYGASSDVFTIIGKTADSQCARYDMQRRMDALEGELQQVEGVESTASLSSLSRQVFVLMNEGNPKWADLLPTQSMLNSVTNQVPPEVFNSACNTLSLMVYLKDHKADTLERVASRAETFAAENSTKDGQFLLAAGNAGIEAATNSVVKKASREMLLWVYAAVIVLCMVTFHSWRAVVCAVIPLVLTSILCEALMVAMGIGVKVATLPVIALGVGIGVDYALYVMTIVLAQMRLGASLTQAYYQALMFTGKVVMFTGFTLSAGVVIWALSPIKFQADMGILLAFMFLLNMLGALMLLPALAYFLLPQQQKEAADERLPIPAA